MLIKTRETALTNSQFAEVILKVCPLHEGFGVDVVDVFAGGGDYAMQKPSPSQPRVVLYAPLCLPYVVVQFQQHCTNHLVVFVPGRSKGQG